MILLILTLVGNSILVRKTLWKGTKYILLQVRMMPKAVHCTPYLYHQMAIHWQTGIRICQMAFIPIQQRTVQFQVDLVSCNLDYNPENTEQDLEVYTEVKPKEDFVGSNKAAENSESKEKDLRTRMFGFLLGCLASLILAVSAACVQVCTYIQSDVVHDFITNGCLQIFTGRNEVVAKVMFLFVSVILSTGGVSSRENPPSRETPSRESPLTGRPPGRETPQQGDPPAGRPPPRRQSRQGDPLCRRPPDK